jgi:hypothetical protein
MPDNSRKSLWNAIVIGTILQLLMVVSGHWVEYIKLNVFAAGGMAISAIAGAIYARSAGLSRGSSAVGGAVAGGVCAIIGIAVSCALGDVEPMILLVGTAGSAIAGAIVAAIIGGKSAASTGLSS